MKIQTTLDMIPGKEVMVLTLVKTSFLSKAGRIVVRSMIFKESTDSLWSQLPSYIEFSSIGS